MTNRIAIGLGITILTGLAIDYFLFGGDVPVFLGRRLVDVLEFIAFWR
jgi:hypothetical protein